MNENDKEQKQLRTWVDAEDEIIDRLMKEQLCGTIRENRCWMIIRESSLKLFEELHVGGDEPPLCLYGRGKGCEWNKSLSSIYATLKKDIVYGKVVGGELNLKLKRNKVSIKDRKDKNGRSFYDLYFGGKYIGSYVDRRELEEKIKEFIWLW